MKSHKDLTVYQESLNLVEEIYILTTSFPKEEKYGLTSQIKRAAISIPSNIAEGAARNSKKEFARYLYIALGSLAELEAQIEIAARLHFLETDESITDKAIYIRRMIFKLISSLNLG